MAGPNLPSTEAYTLSKIASKWCCAPDKLLDLYRFKMLDIHAYFDNATAISMADSNMGHKLEKFQIDGLCLIYKPDLIKVYYADRDKAQSHSIKHVYYETVDDDLLEEGNSNWPYELTPPVNLDSSLLRITRAEVERFEKEYDIYATDAVTLPTQSGIHPKKLENLLRTIGGLSILLSFQEGKWGTPDNPNVSNISKEIRQLAADRGVSDYGQGNSTLSNTIPNAIKIFLDK